MGPVCDHVVLPNPIYLNLDLCSLSAKTKTQSYSFICTSHLSMSLHSTVSTLLSYGTVASVLTLCFGFSYLWPLRPGQPENSMVPFRVSLWFKYGPTTQWKLCSLLKCLLETIQLILRFILGSEIISGRVPQKSFSKQNIYLFVNYGPFRCFNIYCSWYRRVQKSWE